MANYRMHTAVGLLTGIAAGGFLLWRQLLTLPQSILVLVLAAVGSMLPDVDSDNSRPRQMLFGLFGVAVPLLILPRISRSFSTETTVLLLLGCYVVIQYPLAWIFSFATTHRGNFHSIPAVVLGAEGVFLLFSDAGLHPRLFFAGACLLGSLSHLLLDEIYSGTSAAASLNFHYKGGKCLRFGGTNAFYTLLLYGAIAAAGTACVLSATGAG